MDGLDSVEVVVLLFIFSSLVEWSILGECLVSVCFFVIGLGFSDDEDDDEDEYGGVFFQFFLFVLDFESDIIFDNEDENSKSQNQDEDCSEKNGCYESELLVMIEVVYYFYIQMEYCEKSILWDIIDQGLY